MTRLIRILCCTGCPHYRTIGEVCRNPEYFDEFGATISRSVCGYDEIPDWCPLEEETE